MCYLSSSVYTRCEMGAGQSNNKHNYSHKQDFHPRQPLKKNDGNGCTGKEKKGRDRR